MNVNTVLTISGNKVHYQLEGQKTSICKRAVAHGAELGDGDLCKMCEKNYKKACVAEENMTPKPSIPENIMFLLVNAEIHIKKSWARIASRKFECPDWVLSLASN